MSCPVRKPSVAANLHAILCPSQRDAHCTRRQRLVVVSARRHRTIRCARALHVVLTQSAVTLMVSGVVPRPPSPQSSFPAPFLGIFQACSMHAGDVVTLTDDNFDQQLAAHPTDPWFIAIGAPWCPRKRPAVGALAAVLYMHS